MKEFTYVIKEELGLHARPAGLLVKEAKKFQSATTLAAKGKTAAAGKLIAIMSMGVKQGDEVTVQVEFFLDHICKFFHLYLSFLFTA